MQWIAFASPGGAPLNGTIPISGAKNAALPLMIASLLTDETLELTTCRGSPTSRPLLRILGNHGVDHLDRRQAPGPDGGDRADDPPRPRATIIDTTAPYELVSTHAGELLGDRAAAGALRRGPGLAARRLRHRHAAGRPAASWRWSSSAPTIEIDGGYVVATAPKGLSGGEIVFPKVTVGGTHVALMAAALASGTTVIENAAREPEVVDLADCLIKMGARIEGAGTGADRRRGRRRACTARRTTCCPTASRPAPTPWRWP